MLYFMPGTVGRGVRNAVLHEIENDPEVPPSDIGVTAEDGLVTLTGYVASLAIKVATERAVKRVPGVRSIANDLRIRRRGEQTDTDIAREALHRLRNDRAVPPSVQAVVRDGFITLDGTVSSMHQRLSAEYAVRFIQGVKGVANDITLDAPQRQVVTEHAEPGSPRHA